VRYIDSAGKRVLLTVSGRDLHAFWLGIGRALNEHPYIKHWAQAQDA